MIRDHQERRSHVSRRGRVSPKEANLSTIATITTYWVKGEGCRIQDFRGLPSWTAPIDTKFEMRLKHRNKKMMSVLY